MALAGRVLVEDDIRAGRLVNPFEVRFPVKFAYYLVYPEAIADQPRIVAFVSWLKAEAQSSRQREQVA